VIILVIEINQHFLRARKMSTKGKLAEFYYCEGYDSKRATLFPCLDCVTDVDATKYALNNAIYGKKIPLWLYDPLFETFKEISK
jgi:hypothetical protein